MDNGELYFNDPASAGVRCEYLSALFARLRRQPCTPDTASRVMQNENKLAKNNFQRSLETPAKFENKKQTKQKYENKD
jgi:hypothetical protein